MAVDQLSGTLAALADPTRRAILERLTASDATLTEIAAPLPMSIPAVAKHLRVLERAGLITRGRAAQARPCRLAAGPLAEVSDWVARYRRYWDESFDRLDEHLRTLREDTDDDGQER